VDSWRGFRLYTAMRFDAVAFDLDGTLYPNASLYSRALPAMLRTTRAFVAFSAARNALREMSRDPAGAGKELRDQASFRATQASLVAKRLGIPLDEAAALIEDRFYRGVEELFARVRPFRGVEGALYALSSGGLRLALLSDLPPARKLELLGFSGRFEAALCSEESGLLKPARAPFELLASRLALPLGRILYVGNSPAIDLAGAKAAGMSAAIVSRRRVRGADLSFYDWRELVAYALA
jgi:putative hydrolase of the HAD superfamily